MSIKPTGGKAYGSIPHLPGSKMGEGDYRINDGQAKIATQKARDNADRVIVLIKYDGTGVAVYRDLNGYLQIVTRSGFLARTSPYLQHHLWEEWVNFPPNYVRFDKLLAPGQMLYGEWVAQTHGIRYRLHGDPFVPLDLFDVDAKGNKVRLLFPDMKSRVEAVGFKAPQWLNPGDGKPIAVEQVLKLIKPCQTWENLDPHEGVVYRVERMATKRNAPRVDYLCKWVREDFVPGQYLPEQSGGKALWNEGLEDQLPPAALEMLRNHDGSGFVR